MSKRGRSKNKKMVKSPFEEMIKELVGRASEERQNVSLSLPKSLVGRLDLISATLGQNRSYVSERALQAFVEEAEQYFGSIEKEVVEETNSGEIDDRTDDQKAAENYGETNGEVNGEEKGDAENRNQITIFDGRTE